MDSLNYDNFTENEKQLETRGNVFMISRFNLHRTKNDTGVIPLRSSSV
jgi:hypothetical protein